MVVFGVCFFSTAQSQQLKTVYDTVMCGLNYAKASTLLTKRVSSLGAAFTGTNQPAILTINSIPNGSAIEKAYVWWDIAGDTSTANNIIIENPSAIKDTFRGTTIGGGNSMCWGKGYAFRADITSIINGNGAYKISGLPSDSSLTAADANGITMFIVYSDLHGNFAARIKINDGYIKIDHDTITETISNLKPLKDNTALFGKGFALISDLEGESDYYLQINGGPFLSYLQGFWDYEEKNTAFLSGQNSSVFGVRSPNDCSHLIAIGVYQQDTVSSISPVVFQQNDTIFTTSIAPAYQWYLNDTAIIGAVSQTYTVLKSGVYRVEVANEFRCYYSSDTLTITTCQDKIKPNINVYNDSLWTDSVNYALQWFYNGTPISGATNPYYTATIVGNYWVKATDTIGGCTAISDTVYSTYAGLNTNYFRFIDAQIIPNPNSGNFLLRFYSPSTNNTLIAIFNVTGEQVYAENIKAISGLQQIPIHNKQLAAGVYMLKIISGEYVCIKKLVVD